MVNTFLFSKKTFEILKFHLFFKKKPFYQTFVLNGDHVDDLKKQ